MNRRLPFFWLRLAVAILFALYAMRLAWKGQWFFAAFDAVACSVIAWRLFAESEQARRMLVLEGLSTGAWTGLELVRRSNGKLGQGTVYPTLRGMERDGLVTSREGMPVPERGNRPRRYYVITHEGRAWLERNKDA